MANVIFNLHLNEPIAGNVNNISSNLNGVLVPDALDYETGLATGISLACYQNNRTVHGNGRDVGEDSIVIGLNGQGQYRQYSVDGLGFRWDMKFPTDVSSATIDVFICTTFNNQKDIVAQANGVVGASIDSTNNTTGVYATLTNVVPDVDGNVLIVIDNLDPTAIGYTFINGFRARDIVTTVPGPITGTGAGTIPSTVGSGVGTAITEPKTVVGSGAASSPVSFGDGLSVPQFTDYFPVDGAIDPSWEVYNASGLPTTPQIVNGKYNSGPIPNIGNSAWFNTARGRAEWKLQSFPDTGYEDYIFANAGISPVGDDSAESPYGGSGDFRFCGAIIHDENTSNGNYEFLVVGHRGSTGYTLENKRTTNNNSSPIIDEGSNALGAVTHADVRLRIYADKAVEWAYRAANSSDAWILTNNGTGSPAGSPKTWSSNNVYIGIIAYCYTNSHATFVGTVDSAVKVSELPEPKTVTGSGDGQASATFGDATGSVARSHTATGAGESPAATGDGVGSVARSHTAIGTGESPVTTGDGVGSVGHTATGAGESPVTTGHGVGSVTVPGTVVVGSGVGHVPPTSADGVGSVIVPGSVVGSGAGHVPRTSADGAGLVIVAPKVVSGTGSGLAPATYGKTARFTSYAKRIRRSIAKYFTSVTITLYGEDSEPKDSP